MLKNTVLNKKKIDGMGTYKKVFDVTFKRSLRHLIDCIFRCDQS